MAARGADVAEPGAPRPEAVREDATAQMLDAFRALFEAMPSDLRRDLMTVLRGPPCARIFENRD